MNGDEAVEGTGYVVWFAEPVVEGGGCEDGGEGVLHPDWGGG